ncbi:MAG: histidinol dehydrogenase [Salinarimonas sp.]
MAQSTEATTPHSDTSQHPQWLDYTARFDRYERVSDADWTIGPEACEAAYKALDAELREALDLAAARIRAYHAAQLPEDRDYTDEAGVRLGAIWRPVDAAGLYVPGGRAAYPSSLLMNAIPARVAGVERLAICTPTPQGKTKSLVLAAAHVAGLDEVWRGGGRRAGRPRPRRDRRDRGRTAGAAPEQVPTAEHAVLDRVGDADVAHDRLSPRRSPLAARRSRDVAPSPVADASLAGCDISSIVEDRLLVRTIPATARPLAESSHPNYSWRHPFVERRTTRGNARSPPWPIAPPFQRCCFPCAPSPGWTPRSMPGSTRT